VADRIADVFRQAATHMGRIADTASYLDAVGQAVNLLEGAFRTGHKLLVFGNGGSAADAQHLTAELVGRFEADRRPVAAIALTTNQSILTAWSNDHSFDDVFARQVEALGREGDVALGISTSGNSANVVQGLRRARELGLRTAGLTGKGGGALVDLCDVLVTVPLESTARIQEVHLVTYHAICGALEERLLTS
jgi:D-sedoheptulose 7-phosphate isomerase